MFYRRRTKRKRVSTVTNHYLAHKEAARALVHDRLVHYNQHYQFTWGRVAIKNQRRCWGSCSSLKNLNFNYKILFLPPHLQDYIVVHELCHLQAMHHGPSFWSLVAEQIPAYVECRRELRQLERAGVQLH